MGYFYNSFVKYWFYLIFSMVLLGIAVFYFLDYSSFNRKNNIKVGVLFSLTGSLAISERSAYRATLMAIDEINQKGGIDNRLIIPIIYNPASVISKYGQLAEKMITKDKVKVIFGCWTTASRKTVKPVVEKFNNLLIYSVSDEGTEESNNIIYLGATPNQSIYPAVSWLSQKGKKRAYFVGTDSLFGHVTNAIITHILTALGGEVVGTDYLPLGSSDVSPIIKNILQKKPDVIFHTINGSSNVAFFNRLNALLKNSRPPVVSFRLSSANMAKIGMKKFVGDYAVASYFPSLENEKNIQFLKAYKNKYGSTEEVNDPAVTAYTGVYFWAYEVTLSPSASANVIRNALLRDSVFSPAGVIYIDPINSHTWRTVRIAEVNSDGKFSIVWSSDNPVQPIVFPDFKSRAEWDLFEYALFIKWHNSWEGGLPAVEPESID